MAFLLFGLFFVMNVVLASIYSEFGRAQTALALERRRRQVASLHCAFDLLVPRATARGAAEPLDGSGSGSDIGFFGRSADTAKHSMFPTFLSWLKSVVAGEFSPQGGGLMDGQSLRISPPPKQQARPPATARGAAAGRDRGEERQAGSPEPPRLMSAEQLRRLVMEVSTFVITKPCMTNYFPTYLMRACLYCLCGR